MYALFDNSRHHYHRFLASPATFLYTFGLGVGLRQSLQQPRMDLGGPRSSIKRTLPPLDRGDEAKRPKLPATPAKPKGGPAPFDLANVLAGASDAAKIRQQYVFR